MKELIEYEFHSESTVKINVEILKKRINFLFVKIEDFTLL